MRSSSSSLFKPLLLAAVAWLSGTVLGQSLSILRDGANYKVEASAPASNPHTLQASENLHLWINLQENVTARYSHSLTNARNFRYFRLKPTETVPPIRIMLLGDSLGSDCCGWGQALYGYLNEYATFINYAIPNTSTKVFLQSAEKDNMLLIKPDFVLLNYGFIDNALPDPRAFTTLAEFEANLKTIAQMVRDFGGTPIFVAVQAPRVWDENGKITGGWGQRNEITRSVAAEFNALYIDFEQITKEVYEELGPNGTGFMDLVPDDYMHFSALGAKFITRYFVNALPDNFAPYLKDIFDPPPIP
jgi:lysophospholipase L1-like esterase